jgi:hypothetical protein
MKGFLEEVIAKKKEEFGVSIDFSINDKVLHGSRKPCSSSPRYFSTIA